MMDLDMKKSLMVYELLRKILGKVRNFMEINEESNRKTEENLGESEESQRKNEESYEKTRRKQIEEMSGKL